MSEHIRVAQSDDEVRRCFTVMRELRPHIVSADDFLLRVREQEAEGFRIAFVEAENEVRAVAGRVLYVDDLVTRESERSRGYGEKLFDWLVGAARAENCATLELDSGVQRFAAHRFYLRHRMDITSHHLRLKLE
ncbi:MAG: GNAT family N-acetyltransferase [Verrucomicrobiota bacterium]|nr:GNAT family N-acetyltransferase [Verrucomicrobiota bacterium]